MPRLSFIVPALDEAERINRHLLRLEPLRRRGHEVILVDGGSHDGTPELARGLADRVSVAPRGRASQMNAGAALARGDILVFVHADTALPEDADRHIAQGLAATGSGWGRFDVRIEGKHPLFPAIAWFMNRRSRLTGIATGDQCLFARREVFFRAGGFPDIPLMEDIAISKALKTLGAPLCLACRAVTSGRRWESRGVCRTVLTMWRLRLCFFLGANPERLARAYGYEPRQD